MRRSLSIMVLVMLLAMVGSVPAHAYATWHGNKLVYGIGGGGQAYWIAPSASSAAALTDSAMANWINTSSRLGIRTPLYWSKTQAKSDSRMEIHSVSAPNEDYCAIVTHYRSGSVVEPWLGSGRNWVWGKVDLNSAYFWGAGCPNRQGIVSHEMGHVFGLAHTSNSSTLMYTWIAGTGVLWATADEANGINGLY